VAGGSDSAANCNAGALGPLRQQVVAFHEGLKGSGFVDGQNVTIEYVGRKVNTTDFRHWQLIWSAGR
jgi:hypothetical protein